MGSMSKRKVMLIYLWAVKNQIEKAVKAIANIKDVQSVVEVEK